MSAISKQIEPPERAADRLGKQPPAVLRDPTTPQSRDEAPRGDDQSHTPPHGDALLPHGLA
jgi:hypothetical protein